ncbi:hypothetical protein TBLA_0F02430 [Henningerozyma blattae CBS 6284]|uniref:Genetic interactor of prohibitin 7, mitochondrial n=1 Tax=Henningerozyma blattae (strain ATCC 34711 / CBS 6284 / DSM 70876 / NBRC 10599 / NRRL Y-10934 / UCD 77-7) TaxID=1071380 RepID=I2H5Y1_HENB6|nr:hypothetical protein TBLA_0F02430 [Tetrapisispora blattae CBS 6284]CCH61783.1 hypothetical protein TBLA_0F02430 [Tetrapisispora blattae CBS 6284]
MFKSKLAKTINKRNLSLLDKLKPPQDGAQAYPQVFSDLKQLIIPSSFDPSEDDSTILATPEKLIDQYKQINNNTQLGHFVSKINDTDRHYLSQHLNELSENSQNWNSLDKGLIKLQYYLAFGNIGPRNVENLQKPSPQSIDPLTRKVLYLSSIIALAAIANTF